MEQINHKEITKRVKQLILTYGYTGGKLAKEAHIPKGTFSRCINENAPWQLDHLMNIMNIFKIRWDWLILGKGDMDYYHSVTDLRIANKELRGEISHAEETKSNIDSKIAIPSFTAVPILTAAQAGVAPAVWVEAGAKNHLVINNTKTLISPFIAIVEGDSMRDFLLSGDKVLCSDAPEKIKKKKLVMVAFKSSPETTENSIKLITWAGNKEFTKLTVNDIITLYSINTRYEPQSYKLRDIHKVYKVIRLVERNIN